MVVIRESKFFYFDFDWHKNVDENLKHETEFIIKNSKSLGENKMTNKIEQLCPNISTETIFTNMENSKKNEPQKFVLNLSQRLDKKFK